MDLAFLLGILIAKLFDPLLWIVSAVFIFVNSKSASWVRILMSAVTYASLSEMILNEIQYTRGIDDSIVGWIFSFIATVLVSTIFYFGKKRGNIK